MRVYLMSNIFKKKPIEIISFVLKKEITDFPNLLVWSMRAMKLTFLGLVVFSY